MNDRLRALLPQDLRAGLGAVLFLVSSVVCVSTLLALLDPPAEGATLGALQGVVALASGAVGLLPLFFAAVCAMFFGASIYPFERQLEGGRWAVAAVFAVLGSTFLAGGLSAGAGGALGGLFGAPEGGLVSTIGTLVLGLALLGSGVYVGAAAIGHVPEPKPTDSDDVDAVKNAVAGVSTPRPLSASSAEAPVSQPQEIAGVHGEDSAQVTSLTAGVRPFEAAEDDQQQSESASVVAGADPASAGGDVSADERVDEGLETDDAFGAESGVVEAAGGGQTPVTPLIANPAPEADEGKVRAYQPDLPTELDDVPLWESVDDEDAWEEIAPLSETIEPVEADPEPAEVDAAEEQEEVHSEAAIAEEGEDSEAPDEVHAEDEDAEEEEEWEESEEPDEAYAEDEDAEEAEEEEEWEESEEPDEAYAEDEDAEEAEEEEEWEESEEPDEAYAEDEDAEEEAAEETPAAEEAPVAEEAEEVVAEATPVEAKAGKKDGSGDEDYDGPGLFDELEEEPVDEPVAEAEAEEAPDPQGESEPESEPEVELEPAPRAEDAPKVPVAVSAGDDRERQVFECGLLFVEEGRVAVSMLQKRFAMDFKEATAILDDLQERGLIGPYLGGKKRDILLTREEWMERAASPAE